MKKNLVTALAALGLSMSGGSMAADSLVGLIQSCNNCHGVNGISAGQSMPSIGGLPMHYLETTMLEWKNGTRYSATMGRLIKGYTDEEIVALAQYFSQQPWQSAAQATKADLVEKGRQASKACAACHGKTGKAVESHVPNLNGQWAQYLELELMKYLDEAVDMPDTVRHFVKKLNAEDVPAVAEFYANQKKQ